MVAEVPHHGSGSRGRGVCENGVTPVLLTFPWVPGSWIPVVAAKAISGDKHPWGKKVDGKKRLKWTEVSMGQTDIIVES